MKKLHKLKLLFLAALFGVIPLLQSLPAKADTLGATTSYNLPSSSPTELLEDNSGNIWTNGQIYNSSTWHTSYYANKVNRSTGSYTTYDAWPNSQIMALGPDNNVWASDGYISKTDTTTGARSIYYPTSSYGNTANTTGALTAGPDGNIWFSMDGNNAPGVVSRIGRMNMTGAFQPPFDIGATVTSLTGDSVHNVVWFTGRYTSGGGVLGSITSSGVQTQYVTSTTNAPRLASIGPDGNVWFFMGNNQVGKMLPSGTVTYYALTPPGGLVRAAWGRDGYLWATIQNKNQIARIATDGTATYYTLPTSEGASDITGGRDGSMWLVIKNAHQLIKFGTGYTDNDEDGLIADQETAQGSSDSNWDTDGDGLSDLTESTSYGARNDVFCDATVTTCEYPDPTTKDIYVENDWMDRAGANAYSGKLSNAQVNSLKTTYLFKGIKLHVDTGQLGGGNEVPYNASIYFQPHSGQVDFYDYKEGGDGVSRQFNTNRHDIYHYLLTGNTYAENTASSGSAYGGDDDLFISYGLIKDNPSAYSNFDTAISGSVMHELGHNLCLTTDANGVDYGGQPASCRFSGIDAHDGGNYPSVMNYDAQFYQVNYSDGLGMANDHDDWSAIRPSDFIYSGRGDLAHGALVKNPTLKKHFNKRADSNKKPIFEPNIHLMRKH